MIGFCLLSGLVSTHPSPKVDGFHRNALLTSLLASFFSVTDTHSLDVSKRSSVTFCEELNEVPLALPLATGNNKARDTRAENRSKDTVTLSHGRIGIHAGESNHGSAVSCSIGRHHRANLIYLESN